MAEPTRRLLGGLLLGTPLLALPAIARAEGARGHDFRFPALEGGEIDLAAYRGRPLLVVNTASLCGFTRQFAGLQALHERAAPRGLLLLAVPSEDFNQELGSEAAIKSFCDAQFGLDFPMTARCHVKGAQAHPFFAWAAAQSEPPRWNFFKYLVGRDGRFLKAFPSRVEPDSPELTTALEAALA